MLTTYCRQTGVRGKRRAAALWAFAAMLVLGGVAFTPASARAYDLTFHLSFEADATIPMLEPQSEWFGPGAGGSVTGRLALTDWLLLGIGLRGGFLSDGPAPRDATLADPGIGDLYTAYLHFRLRPLSPLTPGPQRATGFWVDLGGGGTLTGGEVRPSVEAGLGYGFEIDDFALGPVVRWMTVFETDNQLDDRPAHILLAGIEFTILDARPMAVPEEAPTPPGDRDGDGILDPDDACPDQPEDPDDFEDGDGCPDPDNDRDGILDVDDECPLEPEDIDEFEDEDGCPDPDNDQDNILDGDDECPNEAEVINGVDDSDGCPDEGLIEMINDRIVLEETVLFDVQRARVKTRARPVLRAIAELYRQHPEWTRLRIEGHADVRGSQEYNQRLSELRARRVRAVLVEYGIPSEIIDAVGYGETRPRDVGESEENHQANRRVEFVVLARRRADGTTESTGQDADEQQEDDLPPRSDSDESGDGESPPADAAEASADEEGGEE